MINRLGIGILAIVIFIVGMILVTTLIDYLVNDKLTKTKYNKKMHKYRIQSNNNYKFIEASSIEKMYDSNAYIDDIGCTLRYNFSSFYIYDNLYHTYLFFSDYKDYKKYFHFLYHVVHRCKDDIM